MTWLPKGYEKATVLNSVDGFNLHDGDDRCPFCDGFVEIRRFQRERKRRIYDKDRNPEMPAPVEEYMATIREVRCSECGNDLYREELQ